VAAAARERGLYVITGFPPFLGRSTDDLRCNGFDWHPNAAGHALLGLALADGLRSLPAGCWDSREHQGVMTATPPPIPR
jgi:hypothetical protein